MEKVTTEASGNPSSPHPSSPAQDEDEGEDEERELDSPERERQGAPLLTEGRPAAAGLRSAAGLPSVRAGVIRTTGFSPSEILTCAFGVPVLDTRCASRLPPSQRRHPRAM